MTDMEFYMFWGLCLAVMVGFGISMGILDIKQKKRQRKQREKERLEADRIRRWNSGVEAAKDLW
jgi:hypothetical protein